EESLAVLDQFVDHRNYDTDSSHPGRWRSLALKAQNGDPTNTYAHSHYRQAANYQLTDIAQHCPYTMDMLSLYTDVSKCQRIRFMLLEPGAKIHVHTDSQGDDVTLAVNIALNMPEGCEFWIDTNPDGSHNEYTQKIPVTGGQAFLLNNAKFHYVVNNSDTPRIHVIFHGPLRCSDKELLDAAREQNGTGYEKGVINSLVVKKSFLGEKISHDSKLYSQWITAGIHTPLLPKFMKTVLLFDDQKNPEVMHEAKHYITQASIFPLEHELCEYRHLDTKLEEFHQSGVRYLIAIGAGTYCESFADFIHNTLLAIHEMKANNSPAMAHIIDHKDRKEGLPYFHEQFFILDLQKWDELGRPKIQKPYHHNEANFPAYKKGPSFHDGYTPKFLHPQIPQRAWFFTRSHQEETGMGGLGTELMASALRHGQSLLNVPMYLRDKKMYSYPFAGSCWQRDEVKKRIENRIGWDKDHVFVFNNEDPFSEAFEHLPNFCPQNLYSVAAGMKPYMLNQKIQDRCGTPANLHFFDFSQPALEFHKNMVFANKTDCISYLADQFKNQLGNLHKDAIPLAKEKLDSLLNTHYQGEFGPLKNQMAMGGKSFTELNLLKEPEKLIAQIDFSKPFMIWHSNIWKSNNSLYYLNQNELRKNYDDFIQALSEKLKMKAWINPSENLHDAVIGESLQQPFALITCGNGWCRPSLKWRQI
ncbi:MAG: aspartyl/asparaginyl beta-hydroxylase domain-containing protein, partial [Bdellovibrionales bacterium]|nr:aspartyl/asparaginyl beta-hydroxylase domain-containing protein [Bdellovibrionales bacterium]